MNILFTLTDKDFGIEPKEALELITNCYDKLLPSKYDDVYDTKFVVLRDRKILEYCIENSKV